jgi:maltose O-acetyltransferase
MSPTVKTSSVVRPVERSHRDRMLAGEWYIGSDDEIQADIRRAARLIMQYARTLPDEPTERLRLLRELLRSVGEGVEIRPPFHVDYGYQISVGNRVFANFGLIILDVAEVTIGDDVLIGPNVQLLTATHPLSAEPRRAKWERADPIAIGANAWLGGGVIVCPGVTIGENAVVGAGAVVIDDVPPNVLAVGNPARIVRVIEPASPASRP